MYSVTVYRIRIFFDYRMHRLNLFNQQIPAGTFANIRGLFYMCNFVDLYDTGLTMGLRLRVSGLLQLNYRSVLNHQGGKAGGVLQGVWNFYSRW